MPRNAGVPVTHRCFRDGWALAAAGATWRGTQQLFGVAGVPAPRRHAGKPIARLWTRTLHAQRCSRCRSPARRDQEVQPLTYAASLDVSKRPTSHGDRQWSNRGRQDGGERHVAVSDDSGARICARGSDDIGHPLTGGGPVVGVEMRHLGGRRLIERRERERPEDEPGARQRLANGRIGMRENRF